MSRRRPPGGQGCQTPVRQQDGGEAGRALRAYEGDEVLLSSIKLLFGSFQHVTSVPAAKTQAFSWDWGSTPHASHQLISSPYTHLRIEKRSRIHGCKPSLKPIRNGRVKANRAPTPDCTKEYQPQLLTQGAKQLRVLQYLRLGLRKATRKMQHELIKAACPGRAPVFLWNIDHLSMPRWIQ